MLDQHSSSEDAIDESPRDRTQSLLFESLEMYMKMPFYKNRIPFERTEDALANFNAIEVLTAEDVSRHSPPYSYDLVYDRKKIGPILRSGGSMGRRKTISHSWEFNKRVMSLGLRSINASMTNKPEVIANCFSAGDLTGSFFFGEGLAQKLESTYLPIGTRLEIEEVYNLLSEFEVDTLMATPTFHTQLFEYMKNQPILPKLKNILYLGENFPESTRTLISNRNQNMKILSLAYTTTETGPIGYQCKHQSGGTHHINEDSVLVEILNPADDSPLGDEEVGDIVVTTFLNDGQPMLRYRTGDLGSLSRSTCKCGCSDKVLHLKGRSSQSLKVCGTMIYRQHVLNLIKKHIEINEDDVQMVQSKEEDGLRIQILIDSLKLDLNSLKLVQIEFEKDYNFFHIKNYPGVLGLDIHRKKKSDFVTSVSGKTPFFNSDSLCRPKRRVSMTQNIKTVRTALFYTFLTNLDFLIILPLLPLFVGAEGQLSAIKVASVLSLRVGFSLVGSVLNPFIFAKRSYGFALLVAAIMKSLAFSVLFLRSYEGVLLFSLLSGLGTGFLKPSIRSVIADSVEGDLRKKYFQYFFIAMNLAYVVGPTLARWIEEYGLFSEVFTTLIIIETLGGIFVYSQSRKMFGTSIATAEMGSSTVSKLSVIKDCYRKGALPILAMDFVNYFAMGFMVSTFVLYNEINPSLGEYRNFFLSYEGFALIICQFLLVPHFRKMSSKSILTVTALLYGLGISISFTPSFALTIVGLTFFALAECVGLPQTQLLMADKCPSENRKVAFSLLTFFAILGEICGSMAAGLVGSTPIWKDQPTFLIIPLAAILAVTFYVSAKKVI